MAGLALMENIEASAETKRLPRTEDGKLDEVMNEGRATRKNERTKNGERYTEIDDDDDLDFARLRSNRRQPRKVFDDMDMDNSDSPPSEGNSGRPPNKNRYRARGEADYLDEEEMMSSLAGGKYPPRHSGAQNEEEGQGESFIAKFRRERDAAQMPEDLFKPKRSEDTAAVVRDKTRNIRIVVDQQTACANTFNVTKHDLTEAENEMKDLRQLSLDWLARIEALETTLDVEYRTYETDLQAASQRLHQQRMPDDRSVREEFSRQQADKVRRLEPRQEDLEFSRSPFARRRSGSVSSASNLGYLGEAGNGGMDNGTDRLSAYTSGRFYGEVSSGDGRWNSDLGNTGKESYLSSYGDRSRREGSLTRRDRYTVDMNSTGLGNEDDRYLSSPSRGGSSRPVVDMSANPSRSDAVMKIRAKYASLDETGEGYVTPIRLRSTPRDSAYGSFSSDYSLSDATKGYGGSRRDLYSSAPFPDYATFDPSRYTSAGSDSYGSLSYLPDRDYASSRQAKSYESTSMSDYRSPSSFDQPTAVDYQNKFLSRVRGGSAASIGTDTRSGGHASMEEKPFKSRFLKSTNIA